MAPTPDDMSPAGGASYDSGTQSVGDGTWDFSKNTFLLPNLVAPNYETMRYNGEQRESWSRRDYSDRRTAVANR